ncbi:MAG: hypothetical protein WHS43_06285 [Aquificaceae bacterium]|jgi:hypothetical protein|uniref:hypothetical protein n=1 Tax=Hydrogenobacter sp. Uz 6-8 TaxID=3384828 RepID=UPI0030986744
MSRLNLIFFLLTLVLLALLLDRYYRLRDGYYAEYLRYKEVMLLLKNYQTRQKANIDENFVRQKLSEVGADFVSFKQVDVGYEVKARNLRGENLPRLVYSLENSGVEILKLRSVDNTGQGIYEVDMTIR